MKPITFLLTAFGLLQFTAAQQVFNQMVYFNNVFIFYNLK